MDVQGSVALVTGANRGLGQAFVQALLAAGAKKVYAAARDPKTIESAAGVVPLQLDVTKLEEIQSVAQQCEDVTLLINNAGVNIRGASLLAADSQRIARELYETNFFGPLSMSQAFAPVLARHGGGAIVNVLSALSWISMPGSATYSATKAAAWSLTNGLRNELRSQNTQVVGLHVAFMDTDMTRGMNVPKVTPQEVARRTLEGVQRGEVEILADDVSTQLKQGLSAGAYLKAPSRG